MNAAQLLPITLKTGTICSGRGFVTTFLEVLQILMPLLGIDFFAISNRMMLDSVTKEWKCCAAWLNQIKIIIFRKQTLSVCLFQYVT